MSRSRQASAPGSTYGGPHPSSGTGAAAGQQSSTSRSSYLYDPAGTISDAVASTAAYFSPFSQALVGSSSAPVSGSGVPVSESTRLLTDMAPHIMRPRMIAAALQAGSGSVHRASSSALVGFLPVSLTGPGSLSLSHPARSLARLSSAVRTGPVTSKELRGLENSLAILETASMDLALEEPASGVAAEVSLLRGFQATIPSSLEGRARRRKARGRDVPRLGLKAMSDQARGLLTEDEEQEAQSFQPRQERKARRAIASRGDKDHILSTQELEAQRAEIEKEKEDISIRRMLVDAEIQEVEAKIQALRVVRDSLDKSLLGIREEELELDEEYTGVSELLAVQEHRRNMPGVAGAIVADSESGVRGGGAASSSNSRRRKGPVFLPSEHDELPSGVAFMTLASHHAPITDLDFSEPYGALVSAASDDAPAIVWDLSSGAEVGRLRGHEGTIKCLQVEDELCVTGGADASIRLWDLRRVDDYEARLSMQQQQRQEMHESKPESGDDAGVRQGGGSDSNDAEWEPCLKKLDGHSKSVTSLYFDDTCLVTGASDKTLRQWDLNTGQCVLTMDILWAISNPPSIPGVNGAGGSTTSSPLAASKRRSMMLSDSSFGASGGVNVDFTGPFSYPTPAYEDGSWEMFTDFVGGVQFWGYALASGSGDGAVRMWDMRTGQAHRTLLGHTAPVTCLQFDETHVISGSLDRSIRIWDLRTGGISDTIKFEHPVTALQFDTRKIVAAAGENQVRIFNRTTLQHTGLSLNGHTKPVEKVRYVDRYAVSGGKDQVVKIWSL